MNKKGFTLVELLAVIAILAILVIMALPAVLRMYRQSRINNFQNEVRGVYKSAQQQFVSDSINLESGQKILYTNATSCNPTGVDVVKQLDMTGNTNFKYYVLMNVDGKVLNVRATNGTYSYSIAAEDYNHDLKIENIEVETNNQSVLDSSIENALCLSYEGTYVAEIVNVSSITVSPSSQDVPSNVPQLQLSVTVLPENATNKNVTWSSSNESLATVDDDGLVTFYGLGTVIITATSEDGNKTSTSTITVTKDVQTHSGGEN